MVNITDRLLMLDNLKKYRILLCSKSPRRRELLRMLNVDFDIAPDIEVDETWPAGMVPEEVPLYLSALKARGYADAGLLTDGNMLITADTVVVCGGKVIGKPRSKAEAAEMLRFMADRAHTVVTGVSITTAGRQESFDVRTKVVFAPLSDSEIDYYVENYSPMDKAGAYGIQEWIGAAAVERIEGSFYNVMGLPVHQLYTQLKRF